MSDNLLQLPACGDFHDSKHDITALPVTALATGEAAASRLLALKRRINELQAVREAHWDDQERNGAEVASTVLMPTPAAIGLAASGATGLKYKKNIDQARDQIREMLAQIVQIRARFGSEDAVKAADREFAISEDVFKKAIQREEFPGDL